MIKKIGMLGLLAVLIMVSLTGCHSGTMEGFGSDVEKVGQKISGKS